MTKDESSTKRFRASLDALGMEYTTGIMHVDRHITDADTITTVWPVRDEPCECLMFREDENGLTLTAGEITPRMAVLLCVTASLENEKR